MRLGWTVAIAALVIAGATMQASAQDARIEARGRAVAGGLRFDGASAQRSRGAFAIDRDFARRRPGGIRGRAGGRVPAASLGLPASCPGWFDVEAQHTVVLRGDMPSLRFEISSRRDTTLAVAAADGSVWCDAGPTPRVRGGFPAGVYHVYVGSERPGRPVPYALVVEQDAPVVVVPPRPALDPATLPGTYVGTHPHWSDAVILARDGSYRRGNGDPGRWRVEGTTLVLDWTHWGAERLDLQSDGSFRAATNGFTLVRQSTVVVTPPPRGRSIDPRTVPGTYEGTHPHWRDSVVLARDGTYQRGNGDPGRWSIEGDELVLAWTRWGTERLALQPDGSFASLSTGFTLSPRRGVVVAPPPAPSCRQTLLELGHASTALMFCDGVEPRCADALLRAGHAPTALMFCRDVEPDCAVQMLRQGRAPTELTYCD